MVWQFHLKTAIFKKMPKKELKTVYRIKGLAKEHPANKEFNKFIKK